MRPRATICFVSLFLLVTAGTPALAEKRIALVIGNSAYTTAGLLTNPANDAAAISEMFRRGAV